MHREATYLKSGINKLIDNEIMVLIKKIIEDNAPELLLRLTSKNSNVWKSLYFQPFLFFYF